MSNIKKIPSATVHLKVAPICCEVCGKTFMEGRRYNYHLTLHREKTYKCDQCDKSFNRRNQLVQHLRFHLNPRVKPYRCVQCGYGNDRKWNVRDHIQKVHKKQWTCEDISVDKKLEAWMLRVLRDQADKIQGYSDGQNKIDYRNKKALSTSKFNKDTNE